MSFLISFFSSACARVTGISSSISSTSDAVLSIFLRKSWLCARIFFLKILLKNTAKGTQTKNIRKTYIFLVITIASDIAIFVITVSVVVKICPVKFSIASTSRITFDCILPDSVSLWKVTDSCCSFLIIAPRSPASTLRCARLKYFIWSVWLGIFCKRITTVTAP